MPSHRTILMLPTSAILMIGACGGPNVPPDRAGAPTSPSTVEGLLPVVTRSLSEDPPLPDEDTAGWRGLVRLSEQDHHDHSHHDHHRSRAPASGPPTPEHAPPRPESSHEEHPHAH